MSASNQLDGRRLRGEARKLQIVEATLVVLADSGAGAVTHRAVAAQAGVPVASVSYHFASIEEVLQATLDYADDAFARALRLDAWDSGPAGLARFITEQVTEHRSLLIAEYELYMMAMRAPDRLPTALAWLNAVVDRFVPDASPPIRRSLSVAIEGVCLHSALQPGIYSETEIERLLAFASR